MPNRFNRTVELVSKLPVGVRKPIIHNVLKTAIKYHADLKVTGREHLKQRMGKPTIYIANHLSNIDAPVLNLYLKPYKATFVAGVKLNDVTVTRYIMETLSTISINPGTPDKQAIKNCVALLKSGGSLVIFPEGTRSRSAAMSEAKKGFVLLARLSGASIMPIALEGTEVLLPINDSNMGREKLHKATVHVKFGEAFTLPDKRKVQVEDFNRYAADFCMGKIAELMSPRYRGHYS
ncbi:1-acyl-sn-glycerol-3-phosphate acyltransferase [Clostridium sp. 'deep sea']|uniref:lysophospholipid acyltransferase family protein n=1 Tax=Clostridium sp. 'deep sea' TaxID=2779445 RepID=UPI0018969E86|nr:lysophospholipid acyltransferase family protein [Clostridium sp. 'deep sea']QOR34701.1 1-acyl-sn-glycerol-3-phosphate acyltransferase [Clostridium sp. 'deep sea']